MSHIRQLMSDGKEYTVQSVARKTGLSVATCNTLLKLLKERNEIVGEKRQLNEVGRANFVYRINTEYDSVVLVQCILRGKKKTLRITVLYLYGGARGYEEQECESFREDTLSDRIAMTLKQYAGVVQIMIGLPMEEEKRSQELSQMLSSRFQIPVFTVGELDYLAYSCSEQDGLTAFVDLSAQERYSAISVYNGQIVTGRHVSLEAFTAVLRNSGALFSPKMLVLSLIALLSPDRVLLMGLDKPDFEELRQDCLAYFSDEAPKLEYRQDFLQNYMFGMMRKARELNEERI